MSTSVASLVLTLDSSQDTAASRARDQMAASAKPAAQAAHQLKHAAEKGKKPLQDLSDAANDNAKKHAALSTQAMAAQHSIRSMVDGLITGMPPMMVFGQQMGHL